MESNFWNERYSSSEYAYGTNPNDFLKQQNFPQNSRILCLAEGEGRNAVYLATLGHKVTAIDYSEQGLEKMKALALRNQVHVETVLADLSQYRFQPEYWDAIVMVFGHFPPQIRQHILGGIYEALKPGGVLVMEVYSKAQLQNNTGGPKDLQMLYDAGELRAELSAFQDLNLQELNREVHEGQFHNGLSSVIQLIARKQI